MKVDEFIEVLKLYKGSLNVHNVFATTFGIDKQHQEKINDAFDIFKYYDEEYKNIKNKKYILRNIKGDNVLIDKSNNKIIERGYKTSNIKDLEILYYGERNKMRDILLNDIGLEINIY